jgi:CBS domain-containing protein
MTYGAIGVSEEASLAEVIETMLRSHVSALFVFDADHALAGVLSEGDLLRRNELGAEPKRPRWLEFLLSGGALAQSYVHSHGRKAGEIMTRDVVTISEGADLSEAIDLMLRRRVKRLPVTRDGTVVAVISRSDLLKGLLTSLARESAPHSDAEIRTAIQAELDKLGWAPRASVRVEVAGGVVTFSGAITDERLRSGLKVIAENTPGVTAVHDHMCWIEPNSGFLMPSQEDEQAGG